MVGDPTVRSVPPLGSVFMGGLGEPDFVPVSCLRQDPASGWLLLPEELAVCPGAPHTSRGALGARGAPWGCRRRQGEMLVLRRGGVSGVLLWGLGGTRCQRWAVGAPARPQRPSPWDLLRGCLWLPEDAAAPLCWGFGVRRGQRLAPCVSAGRGLLWYIGAGSAARGGTGVSPGCHRGVSVLPLRSASSSAAGSCSKSGKCKATAAPGALNGAEPFLLRAPVPRPPVSALAPCPSGPQVPLWVQQCAAGVPWGGTKPGVLCSVCGHSSSELCCGLRLDPTKPCPRRSRFSCARFHPERPARPRACNGLLWCHAWAGTGIPGG